MKFSFDRAHREGLRVSWQFPNKPVVEVVDPSTRHASRSTAPNVAFPSYLTLWGTRDPLQGLHRDRRATRRGQEPLGSGAFCLDLLGQGSVTVLTPEPGLLGPRAALSRRGRAALRAGRQRPPSCRFAPARWTWRWRSRPARPSALRGRRRRRRPSMVTIYGTAVDRAQPAHGAGARRRQGAPGHARWPSTGRRWSTRSCSATASPRSRRSTGRASSTGPTTSPSPTTSRRPRR